MQSRLEHHGLLITFEGGDGAGKTTLIDTLTQALKSQGEQVVVTREPGGCPLGEEIRHWLLHAEHKVSSLSHHAELALFLAARAQHIKELILPQLEKGAIVLCDRFHHSTIAYQGAGRGLGTDKVRELCRIFSEDLWPDVTFFLDVEPEVALKRKRVDAPDDRIEQETNAFHGRVRAAFQKMAVEEKEQFFLIDASLSPEEVFRSIFPTIQKVLQAHV